MSIARRKFIRAFRRLVRINRFATTLNEELDINDIDISEMTNFNVRKKKLYTEGINILDLPEAKSNKVVSYLREELMINPELIKEVKHISKAERKYSQ